MVGKRAQIYIFTLSRVGCEFPTVRALNTTGTPPLRRSVRNHGIIYANIERIVERFSESKVES